MCGKQPDVPNAGNGLIQFHGAHAAASAQTLMGIRPQQAGMVLSAGALVVLVVLPMVGKLTTQFQARYLLALVGSVSRRACTYRANRSICL